MLINGETYVPWDQFKIQMGLANRYRETIEWVLRDMSDKAPEQIIGCSVQWFQKLHDAIADTGHMDPIIEPDLTKCPKCGGPADNGHDRELTRVPNP